MKNLNEYEPTTTDELLRKNATSENTLAEDYSSLAAHAVRLEQKLAACREALESFVDTCNNFSPIDLIKGIPDCYKLASETLAATAP